ncbi:hypothetical protein LOZ12_000372 [Ophidiomyces ophidiicola]|uniref:Uncharacterized protein n=1 Tax=Ophidiomyces ophidiicola TaxID=1387563 RepID=A0ACB8UWC6_9EURO|nr:hypothetical protein LOZ64_002974 [Ophidiomyces ophidiicola]KAI1955230.1 hypothetical protein LOZ62_000354 [Ophidiomyces ophidiicola]KAI1967381.1 hypothetical protein LOZ59_000749 [Ophidiomyces ophidiicola]KAI1974708.1 hypothetical protein LOZ56_001006 [Ophidiomyces ophidiicola]KAI2012292.1 hypothetical protein LOZ50_000211 [Ophidiomyces ophidiicola]
MYGLISVPHQPLPVDWILVKIILSLYPVVATYVTTQPKCMNLALPDIVQHVTSADQIKRGVNSHRHNSMANPLIPPEDIMLPPSPPGPVSSYERLQESPSRHFGTGTATTKTASFIPPPLHIPPPRTRSPLAKTHLRSRSFAGPSAAPCMARAHSSPGLDSRGRYVLASGSGKIDLPLRRPCPPRASSEESTSNMNSLNVSEPIAEQPELQNISTSSKVDPIPVSLSPSIHHTFPRLLRRPPSSPLNPSAPTGGWYSNPTSSPSQQNLTMTTRFNEPYPAYSFSSSSMPSTPTSLRSRSPSISSLETIPDIPDAEAAAIEADQIAKLKAAADNAEELNAGSDTVRRRGTMDIHTSPGSRFGLSRKRWSVCGAEGRQDLDLETIWED